MFLDAVNFETANARLANGKSVQMKRELTAYVTEGDILVSVKLPSSFVDQIEEYAFAQAQETIKEAANQR